VITRVFLCGLCVWPVLPAFISLFTTAPREVSVIFCAALEYCDRGNITFFPLYYTYGSVKSEEGFLRLVS
jgi:hypothetical protein